MDRPMSFSLPSTDRRYERPMLGAGGGSIETEEPPAFAGLVTGELHLHQAGLPALP